MKHILMTGTTGSGKSVFMSSMISTFISLFSTHQLRLMLVDMKRVELLSFEGIPYLLSPVAVEVERVYACLDWLLDERTNRLKRIDTIDELPFLVVFIDTFSDLMQHNSTEFQDYLSELMPQAEDVKIHIVMSDSRPSVDVFTSVIRNLFPTKICFNVSSYIDSNLIIGQSGGEELRGNGDMLFSSTDNKAVVRLQAPYVSDDEINRLVKSSLKPSLQ